MGAFNPLLAFAAGALTILSPCVLPLVPIVLGSAAQRHRYGPLALAAGLVFAFTLVGSVVAAFGASLGIDNLVVRQVGAVALCAVGVVLLVPAIGDRLALLAGPLASWAGDRQSGLERYGLAGQAGIGALLGVVWSPCVGPTLGAAIALAADGRNLADVAVVMASFGLGIASILLLLAVATRGFLGRWRGRFMTAGGRGKIILGGLLVVVGVMILTGLDRQLEAFILDHLPDRLIEWSTMI